MQRSVQDLRADVTAARALGGTAEVRQAPGGTPGAGQAPGGTPGDAQARDGTAAARQVTALLDRVRIDTHRLAGRTRAFPLSLATRLPVLVGRPNRARPRLRRRPAQRAGAPGARGRRSAGPDLRAERPAGPARAHLARGPRRRCRPHRARGRAAQPDLLSPLGPGPRGLRGGDGPPGRAGPAAAPGRHAGHCRGGHDRRARSPALPRGAPDARGEPGHRRPRRRLRRGGRRGRSGPRGPPGREHRPAGRRAGRRGAAGRVRRDVGALGRRAPVVVQQPVPGLPAGRDGLGRPLRPAARRPR